MQYLRNILKNNMKYPKVEGKEFDILRKREYDDFTETFAWIISEAIKNMDTGELLTKKQIEEVSKIAGKNCAYTVVTNQ